MGRLTRALRKLTAAPGVPRARALVEHTVTPQVTATAHQLGLDQAATVRRLSELEIKVRGLSELEIKVQQMIDVYQPAVFNAIASTNGTTRRLMRETAAFRVQMAELDEGGPNIVEQAVDAQLRPHIDTIAWLLTRVETLRAEMMHELRYGTPAGGAPGRIESRIVNEAAVAVAELRLNIGAGHIALPGFVNVDLRELPGIDVVAAVDDLPFEAGSVAEIFSSHMLEHFPELELRRHLLPYWRGLLAAGGTFRAVVPDLEAMSKAYAGGSMPFETLRSVTYGGQEYEGDFHFTGFTPDSISALLRDAGFAEPTVVARGRRNGDCLELEITSTRPAD